MEGQKATASNPAKPSSPPKTMARASSSSNMNPRASGDSPNRSGSPSKLGSASKARPSLTPDVKSRPSSSPAKTTLARPGSASKTGATPAKSKDVPEPAPVEKPPPTEADKPLEDPEKPAEQVTSDDETDGLTKEDREMVEVTIKKKGFQQRVQLPRWSLKYRDGKGDLWSSCFRICREKQGPAWDKELPKPNADMSDLILTTIINTAQGKDEKMTKKQFHNLLFSPLLKLHLTDHECEVISNLYDVNKDKALDREEVASLCRELLGIYCMKTCEQPKKTWTRIELPTGEFMSVNKRTFELSFDLKIEKDNPLESSHLEHKFKQTFEFALAEIIFGLRSMRRQPITKDLICAAVRKFHPLSALQVKNLLDQKVFGGMTHPTYDMKEAVERLKEALFVIHHVRFPGEVWSPITTEERGVFWLNNKSKEAYGCLPPVYVRLLQHQLKDREERLKVIPGLRKREKVAGELEVETAEQKKKIAELEAIIEQERKQNNEKMEKQERDIEALQRDMTSRSEELSSKTIDIAHYKKTIQSLERRIEEYDKMYAQFELNKELLKESQRSVKDKEHKIKDRLEEIGQLNSKIREHEFTIEDLKMLNEKLVNDIREEVKSNEEKEQELEKIPEFEKKAKEAEARTKVAQEKCTEKDKRIKELNDEIDRLNQQIKSFEDELKILPEIDKDTKYLSCQVWTLKKLLSGKDNIIRKQLNQIDELGGEIEQPKSQRPKTTGQPQNERDKLTLPLHQRRSAFTNRKKSHHHGPGTPGSHVPPPWQTTNTVNENHSAESNHRPHSPNAGSRRNGPPAIFPSNSLSDEPTPDYHDFDLQASRHLKKGFRVALREMKREKFGKVPLAGTIKWLGTLDRRKTHHRLYLGLQLDSKVGNTDGLMFGNRLFTCQPGFGKVVLAEDVDSVFDKMVGKFVPLNLYLRHKDDTNRDEKDNLDVSND